MRARCLVVLLSTLAVGAGGACVSSGGANLPSVAGPSTEGEPTAPSPAPKRARRPPAEAEVAAVVNGTRARIQSCYQRAVRRDTRLAGRMTVSAMILPTGAVQKVKVNAPRTLGHALEPCVHDQVSRTTFPPSPKAYGTQFSLRFKAR